MDHLIVIPALNPGRELISYAESLRAHGYSNILIVDDGSRDDFRFIFDTLEADGCMLLRHEVNTGKGRALKDAMAYYLEHFHNSDKDGSSDGQPISGIITVDSDGQHTIEDVDKVAAAMDATPDALILGARDFDTGNVPPKSKFGNKCTKVALKIFIGGNISDTQTGLRGIPDSMVERFSSLHGERFEYETVMMIDAIHSNDKIVEVPIETVYIDNNSETHFNPIKDSIRIYKVILGTFFKYILSSLSSFVVDYGIFCGLYALFMNRQMTENHSIWIATVAARICSSLFNYTINKKVVFKSERGPITLLMYYCLCIVQMAASAALVSLVNAAGFIPVQAAKIVVDTLLFLISFRIQKTFIFKRE